MTSLQLWRGISLLGAAFVLVPAAQAKDSKKDTPAKPPASLVGLTQCRALADDKARLACFDREVAALETKLESKEVAVVDRADVRKTRRSLFGIALPSIKLFDNDDEPEIKEINAVIRSVSRDGEGHLVFTLEDGATWAQTDDFPLGSAVKPGSKVTLKRGTFGSFFADFEKTVPVRAKRIR